MLLHMLTIKHLYAGISHLDVVNNGWKIEKKWRVM